MLFISLAKKQVQKGQKSLFLPLPCVRNANSSQEEEAAYFVSAIFRQRADLWSQPRMTVFVGAQKPISLSLDPRYIMD